MPSLNTNEFEVSEHSKRVLLVISSGSLGSGLQEIDRNLTTYLQYATLWGAVVLIDEADVFLEARMTGASSGGLEHNSLVAGSFLTQLRGQQLTIHHG